MSNKRTSKAKPTELNKYLEKATSSLGQSKTNEKDNKKKLPETKDVSISENDYASGFTEKQKVQRTPPVMAIKRPNQKSDSEEENDKKKKIKEDNIKTAQQENKDDREKRELAETKECMSIEESSDEEDSDEEDSTDEEHGKVDEIGKKLNDMISSNSLNEKVGLELLNELSELSIPKETMTDTDIGRTVNVFRRNWNNDKIKTAGTELIHKWRKLYIDESPKTQKSNKGVDQKDSVVEQSTKRPNSDHDSGAEESTSCKKQKPDYIPNVHNNLNEVNHINTGPAASIEEDVSEEVESYVYVKGDNIDITKFDPVKITVAVQHLLERIPTMNKSNNSLRILCQNVREKRILLNTWDLAGVPVTFSEPHRRYVNTIKRGIIFDVDEELSTDEIEQITGVKAKRIIKKIRGETRTTKQVILHFEEEMPRYIYLGWRRFKVETFIPDPVRCYNCQRYGHRSNDCKSKIRCPVCAGNHPYDKCEAKNKNIEERTVVCPNCREGHPASYKGCRVYQEAREIKRIQAINSISYAQAVKSVRNQKSAVTTNSTQPELVHPTTSGDISTQKYSERSTNDKTIPNVGTSNSIKPVDHSNHDKCVNSDVLIKFVQSIGVLLLGNLSRDELVVKLCQKVEEFVTSLNKPQQTNSISA